MEAKRVLKLKKKGGLAKRVDFPNSFKELEEKAKDFVPIDEKTQKYQFIDETANKEVRHQEDFDLMDNEYENQKTIKISVNVIDKEVEPSENIFAMSDIAQVNPEQEIISFNKTAESNEIKEEADDKMKREIQEIVNNKMKDLQENIAQDIFQSIKQELTKAEQNLKNNNNINANEIIHQGINCNNCEEKNIKGIRYKCIHCPDYNLCQKCESEVIHVPNHIFIKIRKPVKDEKELNLDDKINNYAYKNRDYNYSITGENEIKFSSDDKNKDIIAKQITVTNNGFEDWNKGAIFKCLPNSELKGKDYKIEYRINQHDTVNIEIIFENFKNELKPSQKEYNVYYQMFNSDDEAFGNITKFKIVFED